MVMNIFQASNQWSTRPTDERFWGLADAGEAARAYKATSAEVERRIGDLKVLSVDGEPQLVSAKGPARLSHYAFGQLAAKVGAPANYLRTLPPDSASGLLTYGMRQNLDQDANAQVLVHANETTLVRAVTSDKYARVWNGDVLALLDRYLTPEGFKAPPGRPAQPGTDPRERKATQADLINGAGGIQIKEGDTIAPAGVYVSDHDCYAVLVRPESSIEVPGAMLVRGVIVSNSEVGDASLKVTQFLADGICGNHIIWGARDVSEISIRHIGEAEARFARSAVEIKRFADDSVSDTQAKITSAQRFSLGGSRTEALETLFSMCARKRINLGKNLLENAYDVCERTPRYGSPRMLWGIVNGVTELSQQTGFADKRSDIDRAAGKLLSMAF